MSENPNRPGGRLQLTNKDDRDERIKGGALFVARYKDGNPVRFGNARVFNLVLGDRDTPREEVADMLLSDEYFVSVIVDDEE